MAPNVGNLPTAWGLFLDSAFGKDTSFSHNSFAQFRMESPHSASAFLQEMIRFPSVSSQSNVAITDWVEQALSKRGFRIERQDFVDEKGVPKSNVIARRDPSGEITATGTRIGLLLSHRCCPRRGMAWSGRQPV